LKEKMMLYGKQLGFKELKVVPAMPLPLFDAAMAKRAAADPETRSAWEQKKITSNPEEVLPGAKSLWIAIYPYTPYPKQFPSGMGTYSANYLYYPEGREKMERMAGVLREAGYRAIVNPLLPIKAFAREAGLGIFGRNGLLIHPEYGSFMTIHILLTDALFEYDLTGLPAQQFLADCANCYRCIKACPTGAIGEYATVHLLKCIRHYMLPEEVVPETIRETMGTHILGCEICQRSCPRNAKNGLNTDVPMEKLSIFNIQHILQNQKSGLKEVADKVAMLLGNNYARPQRILSSAVIAAGNTGDPAYINFLKESREHPHPPIRAHSDWALAKLKDKGTAPNNGVN